MDMLWLISFIAPLLVGAQDPISPVDPLQPIVPTMSSAKPEAPPPQPKEAPSPPRPYSMELDADFGYAGYTSIQYQKADTGKLSTRYVDGMAIGGHGEFGLFFLKFMMNYQ